MVLKNPFRRTKIVATLGPMSNTQGVIKDLVDAGVDVFRLNFSHGTHEDHRKNASIIRNIEQEINRPLAIMADLQGPKLRIGVFEDGQIQLKAGSKFCLDLKKEFGNQKRVSLPHPEIFPNLKEGTNILLNDGKVQLRVVNNSGDLIETTVITGGTLSNKKGFNIPDVLLPIKSLTEKDIKDLKEIRTMGIDFVAVSFVQTEEDISYARQFVEDKVWIVAKIEKPKAVENLEAILKESDAVMVARGDLGVEMSLEVVPSIQRKIVSKAREMKKPVIVATQMLESMIHSPVPTRAEVSDVATAVYQGADAVMLSAESASGEFPVEAVSFMRKTIEQTEKTPDYGETITPDSQKSFFNLGMMQEATTKFVATFTESGRTTLDFVKYRHDNYVIALTPNHKTARKMCLVWGTYGLLTEDLYSFSQMIQIIQSKIPEFCGLKPLDRIPVIAGIPFRKSGSTNILHICQILKDPNKKDNSTSNLKEPS